MVAFYAEYYHSYVSLQRDYPGVSWSEMLRYKLASVCTCFSCTCLWTCISFFTKTKRRQSYYRLLRSPFGPVSGITSGCLFGIFLYIFFSCNNNKSTFAQIYSDIWFFCIQCPFDYKNSLNPDWLLHNRRDCDIQTPDKAQ